jgi:hypothetical protein
MRRMLTVVGLICSSAAIAASISSAQPVDASAARPVGQVVQWNRTLLTIVRTPGAQPATIHSTRSFAMMHAAIFDAVNAIDRKYRSYAIQLNRVSRFASQDAAAAAAAHAVLAALYPAKAPELDAALQQALDPIADDARKTEGIRVGETVAARLLEMRSQDGADRQPPVYVFGTRPGDYQSTPPNFPAQPGFTHWAGVTPFVLDHAAQLRPGPPPSLTGRRYARAVNEVQDIGAAGSTSATSDQVEIGRFWNGPVQNYWNEIAQTASIARRLSTADSARLFAYLNLTLADSAIAFYEAKYTYNLWRPITAIRAAAADGNDDTSADPAWLPLVTNSPADPSYPGAHAVISAAAAEVLRVFFWSDRFAFAVRSETLPSVERKFDRFSAAAEEASISRVFAGVHFSFDETTGDRFGRRIARFALIRLLWPWQRMSFDQDEQRDRDREKRESAEEAEESDGRGTDEAGAAAAVRH